MLREKIIIGLIILISTVYTQDSTTVNEPDSLSGIIEETSENAAEVVTNTEEAVQDTPIVAEPVPEAEIKPEIIDDPVEDTPVDKKSEPAAAVIPEIKASSLLDFMPSDVMEEIFTKEALEEDFLSYLKELDSEEIKSAGGLLGKLSSGEDITQLKLEEYNRYLSAYFPEANSDVIQSFIFNTYISREDWPEVTVEYFKFLYLYPNSEIFGNVRQTGIELFESEKYFRDRKDKLMIALDGFGETSDDESERYFAFLNTIKNLEDEAVTTLYTNEAAEFLRLFPNTNKASVVLLWLADHEYNTEKFHSCYLRYVKILTMYPRSSELPYVLFNKGMIQSDNFKDYDAASVTFRNFLLRYPTDTLASAAQYQIALIADNELKDWVQAVDEYQTFADTYPDKPEAIGCLMRLGEIQASQLNQLEKAVSTYHYAAQLYSKLPAAVEALERCGILYESEKKYKEAVVEYRSVSQTYPDSDRALPTLEKCVSIYSKRLKDNTKLKEVLTTIVENYPESKNAKSAQKKLSKL